VATPNGVPAFKDLVAKSDSPPVANWRRRGASSRPHQHARVSLRCTPNNELRGRTYNPWNRARTPGAAAAARAAALAVGIAPLAHGNDLGGSIRYPLLLRRRGIRRRSAACRPTTRRRPRSVRPARQLMPCRGARAPRAGLRLGLVAMSARDPRDPWWAPAPLVGEPVARPIRVALTVDPPSRAARRRRGPVRAAATRSPTPGTRWRRSSRPTSRRWPRRGPRSASRVAPHHTALHPPDGGADINRSLDFTLAAVPTSTSTATSGARAPSQARARLDALHGALSARRGGPCPPSRRSRSASIPPAPSATPRSRAPAAALASPARLPAVSVPTGVAAGCRSACRSSARATARTCAWTPRGDRGAAPAAHADRSVM